MTWCAGTPLLVNEPVISSVRGFHAAGLTGSAATLPVTRVVDHQHGLVHLALPAFGDPARAAQISGIAVKIESGSIFWLPVRSGKPPAVNKSAVGKMKLNILNAFAWRRVPTDSSGSGMKQQPFFESEQHNGHTQKKQTTQQAKPR